MGLTVIIWEELLSSGANVIIWDEMLSSGMKCCHLGGDVIIWSCSACLSCLPILPIVLLHFAKVIFLGPFNLFLPLCLPLSSPCLLSDVCMPFGTKLRSSKCFSLLRNGSERSSDHFYLPRNGSERNYECFLFSETDGIPTKWINISVCFVFLGVRHRHKQNRVTWKTLSSEAFVPLQEPVDAFASYVPHAQMQVWSKTSVVVHNLYFAQVTIVG